MAYGDRNMLQPNDEPEVLERRLAALAAYDILDSEAERSFDDLVFLAKTVCATPVALVSLVAEDRQWFKARIGFDACETSIDRSVCRHGLVSDKLLVIPDLTLDPRTRDNPLVVADPAIRFYAGAPLITPGGVAVGMLCVIDTAARPEGLDEGQERALVALAHQVVTQLEMRKTLREQEAKIALRRDEAVVLRRAMDRLEMAEEVGEMGAFDLDLATRQMTVSREFCRIHGMKPTLTLSFDDYRARIKGVAEMAALVNASDGFERGEFRISRESDDSQRWIDVRARYLTDAAGERTGMTGVVIDVTEQRAVNEEISHRMKNTMALVQAIAGHTLRGLGDPGPVQEFNRRVSALATAHDILLSRTSSSACLFEICRGVLGRLSIDGRVKLVGRDHELASRSVLVLSMLLHELGTNAMKYGALSVAGGEVVLTSTIEPREDGDWLVLDWQEFGGPPAHEPEKPGLGTRLIRRGIAPDGVTDLHFGEDGLRAVIASPLAQVAA